MSVPVDERSIVQRSPEWHEARKSGIGGSDAPAVLGVSPWRTAYDVWVEKTDPTFEPRPPTEAMRWGTAMEPLLRQAYEAQTGESIVATPFLRHPKIPWMIASLDGVTHNDRLVELKTARSGQEWGEPGTDQIPLHYLPQVHHSLAVAELSVADVAVLIAGNDFRIYTVEADQVIVGQIVEAEAAFWKLVETREMPPITTVANAMHRWGHLSAPGRVAASEIAIASIDGLRAIKEQMDDLAKREGEFKAALFSEFGERADTMVDQKGRIIATWRLGKGSEYVVKREPSRRLVLKGET